MPLDHAGSIRISANALCCGTLQGDISAGKMIFGVEGVDPDRRRQLIQLLDIDIYQRLTTMSDGQKRRVQICMGLLKPYDVGCAEETTGGLIWLFIHMLVSYITQCSS